MYGNDSGWKEKRFRYDLLINEMCKFQYIGISDTIPETTRSVLVFEGWNWGPKPIVFFHAVLIVIVRTYQIETG